MRKYKALFLSITVGQGHNYAAKAAMEYLQEQGVECKMLDTYRFLNKFMGSMLDKGYAAIGRYTPKLNKKMFDSAKKLSDKSKMKHFFPAEFTDVVKTKMAKYLKLYNPDIIICTHMFCGILMHQLNLSGKLHRRVPVIGVNTDFYLHPFWEHTKVDYMVVAHEILTGECVRKGIKKEKVLPFGIPVGERFSQSILQKEAREQLGLDPQLYTVLVLSGGMGFGKVPSVVAELKKMEKPAQIVVICGSNKQMKEKLEKKKAFADMNLKVIGYTDQMSEYMDAADIVFTKPGGLTTSEALAKDKTLLLMEPLPGVEMANEAYLANLSLALMTNDYWKASQVLDVFREDQEKQKAMAAAREKYAKKHSAKRLGDFVLEILEEGSN